jgi:hypothetical protein
VIRVHTPPQYYVYVHSIDRQVFYVGIGGIRPPKKGCHTDRIKYERAYLKGKRTKQWKDFVAGRDFQVDIVQHYDTEEQAKNFETRLIQRLGTIANKTGILVNVDQDKPVFQFDLRGNLIKKHLSASEAAKDTGINQFSIRSMCLKYGVRRTAGGYVWAYQEVNDGKARELGFKKSRLGKVNK